MQKRFLKEDEYFMCVIKGNDTQTKTGPYPPCLLETLAVLKTSNWIDVNHLLLYFPERKKE